MPRISYGSLLKGIQQVIEEDEHVLNAQATVECGRAPTVALGMMPHVGIYERNRIATLSQDIRAGQATRYQLNWEIWVTICSGKSYEDAVEQRDDLLSWIELALMDNRDLKGALPNKGLMLGGGDLRSGPSNAGFLAEGSLNLSCELSVTTR